MRHEQFRRFFREASKSSADKGEYLVQLLERRLDNVIYRLRFALSRAHARQLIAHGHFMVNGRKVKSSSFLVNAGDLIKPMEKQKSKKVVAEALKSALDIELPSWLRLNESAMEGSVVRLPSREDLQIPFDTRLIVEYMSR
jgi:small subunit ribosomal protein S4